MKFLFIMLFLASSCGLPGEREILNLKRPTLWTNGVVYYMISSTLPNKLQNCVFEAMNDWTSKTGIKFKERGKFQSNYVYIKLSNVNQSLVGMAGGIQDLELSKEADYSVCAHELGHAIGLRHEHKRSDRDQYVKILWENIEAGHEHNFHILSKGEEFPNTTPYDFSSIMHYHSYAFSKAKGLNTLLAIDGTKLYSNLEISDYDARDVIEMYKKYQPFAYPELNKIAGVIR